MDVTYSVGPRILSDGTNLDLDILASFPAEEVEQGIADPVTGLGGVGYESGQLNKDQTPL